MKLPFTWEGTIEVNNQTLSSIHEIPSNLNVSNGLNIVLTPLETCVKTAKNGLKLEIDEEPETKELVFTVKSYMTKKATPDFDFMAKWNDDIPMPLRTMVGSIVRETKGMYFIKVHGDIISEVTPICMACGKPITNPVSQYFGLGPVCGKHNYVNPFDNECDLKLAVGKYRQQLKSMTWSGWIPKSAVISMEELNVNRD